MVIALACVAMTVAAAAYVFVFRDNTTAGTEKTRLEFLRERKAVLYENLRDLNFDYKAGKIPERDYDSMRGSLEDEAVGVLAEMDKLERGAASR